MKLPLRRSQVPKSPTDQAANLANSPKFDAGKQNHEISVIFDDSGHLAAFFTFLTKNRIFGARKHSQKYHHFLV
jgi:alpha-tubulin suppressor-like RCC1 family protein